MGQCFGEVHLAVAPERDLGVLRHQALVQRRQSHGKFDSRARLRAARQRQLLVNHRQHASAGWLNRDYGAIHVAQGINGCLADNRVFAFSDVAARDTFGERTHKKAFVISVWGPADRGSRHAGAAAACAVYPCVANGSAAAARQMMHAAPGPLGLTQLCGFRFGRIQRVRVDVCRPHAGRKQKCSHHHYQTKTARSQLRHLDSFPCLPRFPIYSDARSLPVASPDRQGRPSPRYYGSYPVSRNNKVSIAGNTNFDLNQYGTST